MSVIQRCPNCGTTQAAAGECQACHDAQVRYFCTNHDPGTWLSGSTCPQCEARRVPIARPTASISAVPSREPPRPSRQARWDKLLRGAVLASRASPTEEAEPDRVPLSLPPAGGWLMRLVIRLMIIALVLVVAIVGGVYLLARSLP